MIYFCLQMELLGQPSQQEPQPSFPCRLSLTNLAMFKTTTARIIALIISVAPFSIIQVKISTSFLSYKGSHCFGVGTFFVRFKQQIKQ